MTDKVTHYFYIGRDNQLKVIVQQYDPSTTAWSALDLSGVTRVILVLGSTTIDSDVEGAFYSKNSSGNLNMDLSDIDGITAGIYDGESDVSAHKLRLTIYDPDNTAGLEIGRNYRVVVKAA